MKRLHCSGHLYRVFQSPHAADSAGQAGREIQQSAPGDANASCQEQDVSSRHQLFNPDAAVPGVFREEPPPSYYSLFGEEGETSSSPSQEKS